MVSFSDEDDKIVARSSARHNTDVNNNDGSIRDKAGPQVTNPNAHSTSTTSPAPVHHKIAAPAVAQGLSSTWQPGPCRPPLRTPSPSPAPSISTMDAANEHRKRFHQETDSLPLTDSWLFKGIKGDAGDLPLSQIKPSDEAVASRRRIEVLTEYTWIQLTKGQLMANVPFPAVYAPGQPRIWQGITTRSAPLDAASEPPVLIDEHTQRQQSFPYEPTFKVLQDLQQLASPRCPRRGANFRNVDIVTDATTLATLFAFLDDAVDTTKRGPFRLELATVRNSLFLTTATHRSRGYIEKSGKGPIPAWVAPALTTLGTGGHPTGPLFLSTNHFRVVRYRFGALVLVVRVKVDFTLENRTPLPRNEDPPFCGCKYERYQVTDKHSKEQIIGFQTLVKKGQGRGTRPGAAGVTSVRFAGWDCAATLASKMPMLWFGRVPYVLDGVVSRALEVMETKLFCARESYRSWEKQHQTSLKRMAGLLGQLHDITRSSGGNAIVIADPGQRSFRLYRPVVKRFPVPESQALAVWGPDEDPAETVYASSTESDGDSTLSKLSATPSGFSDWELEGEKIPKLIPNLPLREGVDSRRAVQSWLDNHESDYELSSDEEDDIRRRDPVCKKEIRAWARNPVRPRRKPTVGGGLDGTTDYDGDDDNEDDSSTEDTATEDTSESSEELEDQTVEQEDEHDHTEGNAMKEASSSDLGSTVVLSSSSSSQSSIADEEENDGDDEDYVISSVEL